MLLFSYVHSLLTISIYFNCLQAPAGKKTKRKGSSIRYTTLKPASEKHKDSDHSRRETPEPAADSDALPHTNQPPQSGVQVSP